MRFKNQEQRKKLKALEMWTYRRMGRFSIVLPVANFKKNLWYINTSTNINT